MFRIAWLLLRAGFWLGLASLFVPGSPLREATTGGRANLLVERTAQDTLTAADRVASWREHTTNVTKPTGSTRRTISAERPDQHQVAP
jgi:hypothetical protein